MDVAVDAGDGSGDWLLPTVSVGWSVGAADALGSGLSVGCSDGGGLDSAVVGVGVGDAVGAGMVSSGVHGGVGSGAIVGSGVSVGGSVGMGVAVGLGVDVANGVGVSLGTAAAASGCGTGAPFTAASAALLFVSVALPAAPPGLRSRLDEAGGAAPADPSTKVLAASPQLSESMTAPPTTRSAMLPPVAERPPLYCAVSAGRENARRVGDAADG